LFFRNRRLSRRLREKGETKRTPCAKPAHFPLTAKGRKRRGGGGGCTIIAKTGRGWIYCSRGVRHTLAFAKEKAKSWGEGGEKITCQLLGGRHEGNTQQQPRGRGEFRKGGKKKDQNLQRMREESPNSPVSLERKCLCLWGDRTKKKKGHQGVIGNATISPIEAGSRPMRCREEGWRGLKKKEGERLFLTPNKRILLGGSDKC